MPSKCAVASPCFTTTTEFPTMYASSCATVNDIVPPSVGEIFTDDVVAVLNLSPGKPVGPVAPVIPVSPVGPRAPTMPGKPRKPCGPCGPV